MIKISIQNIVYSIITNVICGVDVRPTFNQIFDETRLACEKRIKWIIQRTVISHHLLANYWIFNLSSPINEALFSYLSPYG